MYKQLEREEEQLERDYAEGLITYEEFKKEMKLLHSDYRAMAEAEAEEAYAERMSDFYY